MLKQPSSTIVMILRISVVNKDHNYDKFSKTIIWKAAALSEFIMIILRADRTMDWLEWMRKISDW